jgi:hypothetical protein
MTECEQFAWECTLKKSRTIVDFSGREGVEGVNRNFSGEVQRDFGKFLHYSTLEHDSINLNLFSAEIIGWIWIGNTFRIQ